MKIKILAVVLLILSIGFTVFNTIFLQKQLIELTESVTALDISESNPNVLKEAKDLQDDFENSEHFISLSVNHEDLTNIESAFTDLIGELSVGQYKNARVAKNRLVDALSHLRRLSGCNLDAII